MSRTIKVVKYALTSIALFSLTVFCQPASRQKKERLKIYQEMQYSMVNELLKPWYPAAIDTVDGGFLSAFTYEFKPAANQDKMIVTQARHVWSNAKAMKLFPTVAYYRQGAAHGFRFLKDVLWDKEYGGFYTFTDRSGKPKKGGFAPKEAYGNSFALYALAAYYGSTGDTSALKLAIKEFKWLEKHSHDPIYKGYYQHMQMDGTPIQRTAEVPSTAELGYKDQNTSIHLLESFTELYRVWPDSLLRERLREMLLLTRDKIVNPKGNLILFFKPDWTPVSFDDSTRAVIMKHRELDHISFGHDVETGYLMLEASHTLGFNDDTLTERIAKRMIDDAIVNGWDKQVGGFYDEGYYFKDKPGITIIADTKNWWAQAEGLNSLLMMADKYPADTLRYEQKFNQLWDYVKTYLIDHEHGDWYQGGLDKQPQYKKALKGQIWKGTYHNFRALINCTNRLEPEHEKPSTPTDLTFYKKGTQNGLAWKASRDTKGLMGYNIYLNGKKIAFTPLTAWSPVEQQALPEGEFTIRAVDLQDNESGASHPVRL
jgi:mannobiose 2-epimerase